MQLLTNENDPKTIKGLKNGVRTAVQYWASADKSGFDVCAFSTSCAKNCIDDTGRGGFDQKVKDARKTRTLIFFNERLEYEQKLYREVAMHEFVAKLDGFTPAVRLNGTSDIPWEKVKFKTQNSKTIFELFPQLTWYDYTKYPYSKRPNEKLPSNYHLTFSVSEETTDAEIHENIANGRNCAVVFDTKKGQPLPETYLGIKVVDGDLDDLRFNDPKGVIVGLRVKSSKNEKKNQIIESGFVRKGD